jgi:hypothetical protein
MIGSRKEQAFFRGAIFFAMRNLIIAQATRLRETNVKPALPQGLLPIYFSHGLFDSSKRFQKIYHRKNGAKNIQNCGEFARVLPMCYGSQGLKLPRIAYQQARICRLLFRMIH